MREVTPTRTSAIELADERKLTRLGYEFLDEKRMLLATEMLRQLGGLSAFVGAADGGDEKRGPRIGGQSRTAWPRQSAGLSGSGRAAATGRSQAHGVSGRSPHGRAALRPQADAAAPPALDPSRGPQPAASRSSDRCKAPPKSASMPEICTGWRVNTCARTVAPRRSRTCCCRKWRMPSSASTNSSILWTARTPCDLAGRAGQAPREWRGGRGGTRGGPVATKNSNRCRLKAQMG